MATMLFDTLKAFEALKSSGFTEEQAKGLSEALKVTQVANIEGLATKADVAALKTDIENLRVATKAELLLVETRLEGKIKLYFMLLALLFLLTNPKAIDLLSKLLGIVK
ncbi:MAG: hypothetical protein HQK99_12385 [Nitrospirae bacterium]|nr:hypothetical protein [Nitrospirota bacterium]